MKFKTALLILLAVSVFVFYHFYSKKANVSGTAPMRPDDTAVSCFGRYRAFIAAGSNYAKPRSFENDFKRAKAYLKAKPYGSVEKNLREKIINELNIGFLLNGINKRELCSAEVSERKYEEYSEREILFSDPYIGEFSAFFLMPAKKQKKYPAIVGLHGHTSSRENIAKHYFAEKLAGEGFVVAMPFFCAMDAEKTETDISRLLYENGFTLMGLQVYKTLLIIKYLKFTEFIDKDKIAVIGHSGGSKIANIVARIAPGDLRAGVYDMRGDFLGLIRGDIHCETIPALALYNKQVNDLSTIAFPVKLFPYEYSGKDNIREIIEFFNENMLKQ